MSPLHVLVIVSGVAAVALGLLCLSYRRRLVTALGRDRRYPIPAVALEDFDARFEPGEFGTSFDAEVRFLPELGRVIGGVNDRELWILAALAKGARCLFEFGTATGRTAYLWACNAREDVVVGTITLSPDQTTEYVGAEGDTEEAACAAREEGCFGTFLYTGTPVEQRIRQYFGDSKEFDETEWRGRCDVVFVDGSHAYSYVQSDTQKALRMVKPGGIVLWHDYRGKRHITRDVFRFLNEMRAEYPLVRLSGTRIVAWRAPVNEGQATARV
jgi:hypothetical protein